MYYTMHIILSSVGLKKVKGSACIVDTRREEIYLIVMT